MILSHLENGRTVLRQLPDRWLWGHVAVVRRRHVAVVCVVSLLLPQVLLSFSFFRLLGQSK